jgi:heat shock protein HslJ
MKKVVLWLIILATVFLVAGCTDKSALEGSEWVLTSLRGMPLARDTEITLRFEEQGWLSGFAGCNGYGGGPDSGKYSATRKGALSIPQIAITVRECHSPEGVMEQETAYVGALTSAASYQVTEDRLEILDAEGETVLVYASR